MHKKKLAALKKCFLGAGLILAITAAPLPAGAQTYTNTAIIDYNTTPPTPTGFIAGNSSLGAGSSLTALSIGNAGSIYNVGLGLKGNVLQSGGSIQATGENNGYGIYLYSGNFTQSGGSIQGTGENNGYGIYLYSGNFTQSGGSILAKANGGDGIYLGSGNFTQSGGSILAAGNGGVGIYLDTGNFTQSSGSILAKGENSGAGIALNFGNFSQSSGSIQATGENGGTGILLGSGNFTQSGGSLALMPNNGTGIAVALGSGNANFTGNAVLRPGLDLAASRAGLMTVGGAVSIEPTVKLQPLLINSLALAKNTSTLPLTFLSEGSGTSSFTNPANTMTINYLYAKNGTNHELVATRSAYASQLLSRSNHNVSRAIENNSAWAQNNPRGAPFVNTYSALDMSSSQGQLDATARGLTPWAATGLGQQAVNRLDTAQTALSGVLRSLNNFTTGANLSAAANVKPAPAPAAGEQAAAYNNPNAPANWAMWLSPLGRYDNFDAKSASSASMDGNTFGLSTGLARYFDGGSLALSGFFLTSELSGGNTELDANTFGLLGAFRTTPLGSGTFSSWLEPWLEFDAGYAYTTYNQERVDALGFENESDPTQHTARLGLALGQDLYPCAQNKLRLTPIIGVDYTYAWQNDYNESSTAPAGAGLALNVDSQDLNSLRGKVGGELEYAVSDALAVNTHAFYRYEFLDTHVDLDSQFAQTPIAFKTKGEDYNRSSGNLGIGASYNLSTDVSARGGYDLTLGDKYQGHEVNVSLVWEF